MGTLPLRAKNLAPPSIVGLLLLYAILAVPASVAAASDPIPNTNKDANVTSTEIISTLRATEAVLESSDQVRATADHDSALTSATAGTVVDIPKDANEGISLSSTKDNTHMLDIALPNANNTADAQQIAPGTVAYPATNGSANAVQANEDGSVRMLTVIANSHAPSQYDYKVTVPGGGRIELTDSGGAVVVDASGELVAAVDTPWAKDATGKLVETHFTTDGQTLTQHVKHNEQGVSYPVTADPAWVVIAGGIVAWAGGSCAANALSSLGLDAVRWAMQRGDWYWNKKLEDALWNCAWGIVGGGVLRFAPQSIKSWTAAQIKNVSRNILRWRT